MKVKKLIELIIQSLTPVIQEYVKKQVKEQVTLQLNEHLGNDISPPKKKRSKNLESFIREQIESGFGEDDEDSEYEIPGFKNLVSGNRRPKRTLDPLKVDGTDINALMRTDFSSFV